VSGSAFLLAASAIGAAEPDPDLDVEAVWIQQRVSFAYRAADAVHTCAGLRSQLRTLLILLGAHETITIDVQRCDDAGSTRVVHITITSPFESSDERASQRDATARLVARLNGLDPSTPIAAEPFVARWRTVSFANSMSLRLTPADCELLKQLRDQVIPRLSVRVVSDRMRCTSDLASGNRPRLVLAALVMQERPRGF
jgi:hypothetical protein